MPTFTVLADALRFAADEAPTLTQPMTDEQFEQFITRVTTKCSQLDGEERVSDEVAFACVSLFPLLTHNVAAEKLNELQSQHRLLSAELFIESTRKHVLPDGTVSPMLCLTPLIEAVANDHSMPPKEQAACAYGLRFDDEARGQALSIILSMCCKFATWWGFYFPFDEPTVEQFVAAANQFAVKCITATPDDQRAPFFSRRAAVEGWNVSARAIQDVMVEHVEEFNETPCTSVRFQQLALRACRSAMASTAATFANRVRKWMWNANTTFNAAETSYDNAFQQLCEACFPAADDDLGIRARFVLHTDTLTVRATRSEPTSAAPETPTASRKRLRSAIESDGNEPDEEPSPASNKSDESVEVVLELTNNAVQNNEDAAREQRRRAVEQENIRIRRDMARREANRRRNRELGPRQLRDQFGHNLLQMRALLTGNHNAFYELDDPGSDNELIPTHARLYSANHRPNLMQLEERIDLELLYDEVTSLHLDPVRQAVSPADDSILRDYNERFDNFMHCHLALNQRMLRPELTRCASAAEYADHIKMMLHMEKHYEIQTALLEKFPRIRDTHNAWPIIEMLDSNSPDVFRLTVTSVDRTRLGANLACTTYSPSHNVRRSALKKFLGTTFCVGYFEGSNGSSALMALLCRCVTTDGEEVVDVNNDPLLEDVRVRLLGSRYWLDPWNVCEGDVLRITPICSMVTLLRQHRAAHFVYMLPKKLQNILFGSPRHIINQLPNVKMPRSRAEYESGLPDMASLRARVDPGSLAYIDSLSASVANASQKRCLITCLAEFGSMDPLSSSLSQILGPPGTGKTRTIALLVAAVMHHSTLGHFRKGTKYPTVLEEQGRTLPASDNPDGVRILIACPSNPAANEAAAKLREGVPGMDGKLFFPRIVRIGCYNYDYETVEDLAVHTLAKPYDDEVFNPNKDPPLRHPTLRARHQLIKESVVYITTCSTAGGPALRDLHARVSVVLVDEAAHASEPDSLTALVAGARHNQGGRLHGVLIGDSNQLPPVYMSQHNAVTFVNKNRWFRFPFWMQRQFISMFERLFNTDRCPTSWLTEQYRTHPQIAAHTLSFMYGDIIEHPIPASNYRIPANNNNRLQPLTLIDTQFCQDRIEQNPTSFGAENRLECDIINRLLFKIADLYGAGDLNDKITVATPYRQQRQRLLQRFREYDGFLHQKNGGGVRVLVDTIDALQGTERSIVILSMVRSNYEGMVGFLRDSRRLNVACSRPKHLLVVVGDFETLQDSPYLRNLYRRVTGGNERRTRSRGAPGTLHLHWNDSLFR